MCKSFPSHLMYNEEELLGIHSRRNQSNEKDKNKPKVKKRSDRLTSVSEAGLVINQGNANSQSISLKTLNQYNFNDKQRVVFRGEYFQSEGGGKLLDNRPFPQQITSENSILEIKYDYSWIPNLGVLSIASWSKNRFKGFKDRYEIGFGFSYDFIKSDETYIFMEQGYMFRQEIGSIQGSKDDSQERFHLWRSYFEGTQKMNEILSAKVLGEFKVDANNIKDLEVQIEPSLDMTLSRYISLVFSYKYSFDNLPIEGIFHRVDHMYMTYLRAKF